MITTDYGSWNRRVYRYELTVEQSAMIALGDYADDYDLDAIAAAWRTAINDALPSGVTLCGNEFIGPRGATNFGDYPTDEDGDLDIHAIVEGIDFDAIAARFDLTAA
ncbi:hypothetical protein AB0395_34835 [Streptosporangium sp. NPDC051023]|uniref:hypothetical protein n=1 Tax=Streptosporangium sp. NPDC051023 TaxID=3155410 RepID=UPI003450452D